MKFKILLDTSFWIALYEPHKNIEYAQDAERIAEEIVDQDLIIPFPTLYEFINSRLSRRQTKIEFQRVLTRPNVTLLPDTEYREQALENFFLKSNHNYSDISLVDELIKLILQDRSLKIDYLVAFDDGLKNDAIAYGIKNI
jgi:predicted nucleic acid-binding protein